MLLHSKLISLAGIILLAALAIPATAGTLYKWTTEDDSVSFTDDPGRIPERYRDRVETIEIAGLDTYRRYTPDDPGAVASYRERLAARLERLRESNAPDASQAAPTAAGGPLSETIIKVNENTSVRVPTTFSDEGPIVVEEVRVRRKGSLFTIHDTVVRQGDRVLMVVRPAQPHQAGPNDFFDESDLY